MNMETDHFFKWVGGVILTLAGWAAHRYNAIHRKMDRISEDVAVLKAEIEHVDGRLEHIEKKMDRRRKDDMPSACVVKDYSEDKS